MGFEAYYHELVRKFFTLICLLSICQDALWNLQMDRWLMLKMKQIFNKDGVGGGSSFL